MLESFALPKNIASGKYGIYHRKFRDKVVAYLVGAVSFYLVADPIRGGGFGFGTNWTLNRFRNSFGVKKPIRILDFLLRPIIATMLLPLARLLTVLNYQANSLVWIVLSRVKRSLLNLTS